jgi:hypothetical protein
MRGLLSFGARLVVASCALTLAADPAGATFHLMQIEQVIGGVCGRVDQQAVQLRMRFDGQNAIAGHELEAFNAAGGGLVLLIDFPGSVASGDEGDRVLVTTSAFSAAGHGPAANFTINPIPPAYLLAGKVSFDGVWSLAWGGAAYTGTNTGTESLNDADLNFNPPYGGALRWTTGQALQFQGTAGAMSTNNAANYLFTAGESTWTNNAGTAAGLAGDCVFGDGFETNGFQGWDQVATAP